MLDLNNVLSDTKARRSDTRHGIQSEDPPDSHPATQLVASYNGHPHHTGYEFPLAVPRAVVIGNGDVAIDVSRMLVLAADELARTDTADDALQALAGSHVREVVVLGRRGPAQAAFTPPELVELGALTDAALLIDSDAVDVDPVSAAWLAGPLADSSARRNVELLREHAARPRSSRSRSITLRFLRSPVAVYGESAVEGLRLAVNRIEAAPDGTPRAVPTGQIEDLECGLVLRAVGYRGEPIPGLPFDDGRGVIPNAGGRVTNPDGEPLRGEYVVGWIKRGPTGVIGTNKKDAGDTMAAILEDRDAGRLGEPRHADDPAEWLVSRVPTAVAWDGWKRIDRHEVERGGLQGRPRVKLVRLEEMARLALAGTTP